MRQSLCQNYWSKPTGFATRCPLYFNLYSLQHGQVQSCITSSLQTINTKLTFPFSYHSKAWFLDRTLQSNIALLGAGRARATERPILTGSWRVMCLSWNGCELGLHMNTAKAAIVPSITSILIFRIHRENLSLLFQFIQKFTLLSIFYLHPCVRVK